MKTRTYIELPLLDFCQLFPDKAQAFTVLLPDPRYIVRYDYTRGLIEVGYREDNWQIQ